MTAAKRRIPEASETDGYTLQYDRTPQQKPCTGHQINTMGLPATGSAPLHRLAQGCSSKSVRAVYGGTDKSTPAISLPLDRPSKSQHVDDEIIEKEKTRIDYLTKPTPSRRPPPSAPNLPHTRLLPNNIASFSYETPKKQSKPSPRPIGVCNRPPQTASPRRPLCSS